MQSLLPYLPLGIARALAASPVEITERLTEIRLRLGGPLSLTAMGKNCFIDKKGKPCKPQSALFCTEEDISTCLSLLTKGSLYSYDDCLSSGYVPFGKGCRAGVCGEVRVQNGVARGFAAIHGINLRLSRFYPNYGAAAARHIGDGGLKGALVYSPPGRGKTTLLRSIAHLLSVKYRVAIADERAELFVPQLAAGLTDRLIGLKKSLALPMLCRSMSPQVIICDELAEEDEIPLLNAMGTGVCIVASAHGDSVKGLLQRPFMGRLLEAGAFPLLIGIEEDFEYRVEEYGIC